MAVVATLIALVAAVVVTAVVWHGRGGGPAQVPGAVRNFATEIRHRPVPSAALPSSLPPLRTQPVPPVDCGGRVKCVALTFDDGPSRYTATLLDILDALHVKATFFQIGPHALRYWQDTRRAYQEGFAIGDHTVTHPDLTKVPAARVRYEIRTAAQQIGRVTGHPPTMLRPPFGAENARVRALAGMPLIMWNVTPQDWKVRDTAIIEHRVLAKVHPEAIVLLHDTYPTTIAAVPDIVATLKARGYTLVTVPQLLAHTGMRPGLAYFSGP
jgi:peptidoglycan-N-acetylglucosamine deacetylase